MKDRCKCCGSYRSLKLLQNEMKIVKKIDKWLRKEIEIDEMQLEFIPKKKHNRCSIFNKTNDGEEQGSREATFYI